MDKILIVIMDGAADRPVKQLNLKTPLAYARKPNLDAITKAGITGIMDVIAPGIRPGSDTAHLALLGYDPYKFYTGRGAFEALGVGIDIKPGDVAFRCNFATVTDNFTVIDRRAGRIGEGTQDLADQIDGLKIEDVKIIFKPAVEHRGVLVLRGRGLSTEITDIDPHSEKKKILISKPMSRNDDAKKTAYILNEFIKESYRILKSHRINREREKKGLHPANIILPRGAGTLPKIPKIAEKYSLRAACIAGVSLVKGVCRSAGMDLINIKGATGTVVTDINAKIEGALKAFDQNYDLIFVNIKAPDIYGHDGNYKGKVKIIEAIDRVMKDVVNANCLKVITSDHATPVSVRDHSADPVPIVIQNENIIRDEVCRFDEFSCARGNTHRIKGIDMMHIILDLTNRMKKFGS